MVEKEHKQSRNLLEQDTSRYFADFSLEAEQEETDIARALSSSARLIDFDAES
jgi:hypothetical protein